MEELERMVKEMQESAYKQSQDHSWSEIDEVFRYELWDAMNDLKRSVAPEISHTEPFGKGDHQQQRPKPKNTFEEVSFSEGKSHSESTQWPRVDVIVTSQEIVVSCALPGVHRPSLEISLIGDKTIELDGLIIQNPHIDLAKKIVLQEQYHGSFSRTLELPVPVKRKGSYQKWRSGILDIHLIRQIDPLAKQKTSLT